jgi:ubiquinone biosynthesis protein
MTASPAGTRDSLSDGSPVHGVSSVRRAHQIAAVLSRYGLWRLIELLALERFVPFGHRKHGSDASSRLITPIQLRMVLEELGPTFMKLGQVLSTRADLIPIEFQAELALLQDHAPAIPIEVVLATIEAEFGEPARKRFAKFDSVALATGSIGQAHRAILFGGTEVVVKVRRPGVVEQIDEDLKLLRRLAAVASVHVAASNGLDLVAIVREFDASLRAEVDYLHEGHNAEKFAANFKGSSHVHIPQIFWEHTTSRVLVMERITGIRISDAPALRAAGIKCDQVAGNATEVILKMMLEDGFFHADLHPGNLFVESTTCIGLIDFGMVGRLDDDAKAGLGQMLAAFGERDSGKLIDSLDAIGVAGPNPDRKLLRSDLDALIARYYGLPLGGIKFGGFVDDIFAIVRMHRLLMPSALSMLAKTLITAEGMIGELDPDFQMMAAAQPYVERLIVKQNSPLVWGERFARATPDLLWLATESPRILRRAVTAMQKGDFAVPMEARGFDPYVRRLERIADRIVLGMLLAALVIAGGFVGSAYRPAVPAGLLEVVLLGCAAAAAAMGGGLLWLTHRNPKR